MSINNIQLPVLVVADLFKRSLVIPDENGGQSIFPGSKPAYKWLGNNLKKIILLVYSPEDVFLPENQLLLLTKMLEACKLNLGDVAIINQFSCPVNIGELNEQLKPKMIFLFGMETTAIKLPFTMSPFKIQEYNHCLYLCVPSLQRLSQENEEGKLLKSKLWVCLRKVFDV